LTPSSVRARAVFFDAPRSVSVRPVTVTPGQGQQIIRSELIGISHGTEMLFYEGPFPRGQLLEARRSIGEASGYPIRYGYMNVGVNEDGARVFAFEPHQDVFAADTAAVVAVPPGVEPEDAVLYPSMETAVGIVHDAAPSLGDRVLVCGLGVIGLLVTRLLARFPIDVIAIDPVATRRERAAAEGCAVIDPLAAGALESVLAATGGAGVDIAINASSSAAALQLSIDALADEGTVVEASWYGETSATLALGRSFHRRRLAIRASQVSRLNPAMAPRWNRERRTALVWRLVRDIRPGSLITHRFALDDAPEAYELIASRPDDLLQAVLVP
jgi:threonine dehydrogenase-like Zn-dependent dehydrogenase